MASSDLRVLDEINKFEDKIYGKSTVPLTGSILVKKSELVDMLETIRELLPAEFEQCKALVNEVESVKVRTEALASEHLESADNKARELVADARSKAEELILMSEKKAADMVSTHQITQRAKQNAQNIIENAERTSNAMMDAAYGSALKSMRSAIAELERLKISMQQSMRRLDEEEGRRRLDGKN